MSWSHWAPTLVTKTKWCISTRVILIQVPKKNTTAEVDREPGQGLRHSEAGQTFEQRPEWSQGRSHTRIWEERSRQAEQQSWLRNTLVMFKEPPIKTAEVTSPPWEWPSSKRQEVTSAGGVWRNRNSVHCGWEGKLVRPRWRTAWRVLEKLKMELLHDSTIPLTGIHPKETNQCLRKASAPPCSCRIYNSWDMEATLSVHQRISG